MDTMLNEIADLYQAGKGLRAMERTLKIPRATLRRRLIELGIYEGRRVKKPEERIQESAEPVREHVVVFPVPALDVWERRHGASVERQGGGWTVLLPGGFFSRLVSPILPELAGKNVKAEFAFFGSGSLGIGVQDERGQNTQRCLLTSSFLPVCWHVTHPCANEPRLFLASGDLLSVTVAIANISLSECVEKCPMPSPFPQPKILTVGEKIPLRWVADGARVCDFFVPDKPETRCFDLPANSSICAELREMTNSTVRLTLEVVSVRGGGDLHILFGDETNTQQDIIQVERKMQKWEREFSLTRGGFARLSVPHDRITLLVNGHAEITENNFQENQ